MSDCTCTIRRPAKPPFYETLITNLSCPVHGPKDDCVALVAEAEKRGVPLSERQRGVIREQP